MRNVIGRSLLGAAALSLGLSGQANAGTNELATLYVAPQPVVLAVPQAVILPQAITIQPFAVPQVLHQPIVRQRVRSTTVFPRSGLRSLLCR